MTIDHVIVAGSELRALMQAFGDAGFPAVFGGVHAHGTTHMGMVLLHGGAYFELLAPIRPNVRPVRWATQLAAGSGLCGWAIRQHDVDGEVSRLRAAGVPVDAPLELSRQRPDGRRADWTVAFVGDPASRSLLPFLIEDRTPPALRVLPSGMTDADALPWGIGSMVLGVADLDAAIALFRRAYGWGLPRRSRSRLLDALTASFDEGPVVLAEGGRTSWISERVRQFGACPCAVILTAAASPVPPAAWDDPSARWIEIAGVRVAQVE